MGRPSLAQLTINFFESVVIHIGLINTVMCYQAIVKSGASSQTMAVDEFIVGAAQVLLDQV